MVVGSSTSFRLGVKIIMSLNDANLRIELTQRGEVTPTAVQYEEHRAPGNAVVISVIKMFRRLP